MKKYTILLGLVILSGLGWILLIGYRFSPQQCLSSTSEIFNGQQVEIILSQPTHYGQAVLFENRTDGTFGVARLNRHLGLLWSYGGGAYGYSVEKNQPFKVAGFASVEKENEKEQFIIGIKTNNSDIEYIAIGKDHGYHLDQTKSMIYD